MKLSKILLACLVVLVTACVGPALKEPINVDVVGLEPMRSDAMEARFLVKLRVQNPNDQPINFDGLYVELDVRGSRVASGVSNSALRWRLIQPQGRTGHAGRGVEPLISD
jgi:LEA14-like dessication related protein